MQWIPYIAIFILNIICTLYSFIINTILYMFSIYYQTCHLQPSLCVADLLHTIWLTPFQLFNINTMAFCDSWYLSDSSVLLSTISLSLVDSSGPFDFPDSRVLLSTKSREVYLSFYLLFFIFIFYNNLFVTKLRTSDRLEKT